MTAVAAPDPGAIPAAVTALCRRLQRAGFAAFLVGGSVRDLLLGRAVKDWDVATAARPEQVQRLFQRTVPTGIKHGTVTVLRDGLGIEVTTFRGEGAYSDGRRPDSVEFVEELAADLERRDLTINAIALDPVGMEIVDPLDGRLDLERRAVRAVGSPAARFSEDGLRPLRAVRFAAVLEFSVDSATQAAIGPALPSFRRVSAERVRDELLKMMAAPAPSVGVELMRQSGLLAEVLPELLATVGLAQNRHHAADVYRHSLTVCDALRRPDDPVLRLAALLHDIGKPSTCAPHPRRPGENTFHEHERVGSELCAEVARRLRLSTAERERICHLVRHHLFGIEPQLGAAGIRRFVRRVGQGALDALFALREADLAGRPDAGQRLADLHRLRARVDDVLAAGAALSVRDLAVDGHQLMARVQRPPGPWIGRLLRELLERVTVDPSLNERDRLLQIAVELAVDDLDEEGR